MLIWVFCLLCSASPNSPDGTFFGELAGKEEILFLYELKNFEGRIAIEQIQLEAMMSHPDPVVDQRISRAGEFGFKYLGHCVP